MNKTGIMVIGGRLASLYDDCLKMRVYSNQKTTKFKESKIIIRTLNDALKLCTQMGIKRLYVSMASGKDIKIAEQTGIEILEEESLCYDKLYNEFIKSIYC